MLGRETGLLVLGAVLAALGLLSAGFGLRVRARDPQLFMDAGTPEPRRARSNMRWLGGPIAVASFQIPGSARQLITRIERHRRSL